MAKAYWVATYRAIKDPAGPKQISDVRPITGFILAKDDTILIEHYQYGRTDADPILCTMKC
jgi:hypothetical protein